MLVKLPPGNKRWSGKFNETELISTLPVSNTKSLKLNEISMKPDRIVQNGMTPKQVHSKLTKTEERYIADFLSAKMLLPQEKVKIPEKKKISESTKVPEKVKLPEKARLPEKAHRVEQVGNPIFRQM